MVAGFLWSTQERAQCCVHATRLRMVGSSERHCEEHLSHLASGRALFQPCPYCCHCWESLFAAARWGRRTAYTNLGRPFSEIVERCYLVHCYTSIFKYSIMCMCKYRGELNVFVSSFKKFVLQKVIIYLYNMNNLLYILFIWLLVSVFNIMNSKKQSRLMRIGCAVSVCLDSSSFFSHLICGSLGFLVSFSFFCEV